MRKWESYKVTRKTKWDWVWWIDENIITTENNWERYPITNLYFPTDKQKNSLHPTQKPVALIEYLIKTYTNEWETVLDFTAWSFTTAIASENTNRHWICIEKEKEYFDIGIKRLETLTTNTNQ